MSLTEKLQRRYASKMMNGDKIDHQKLEHIKEAIRLAPTSLGLQPFKVYVIENQEMKQSIFDLAATGQPQIPTCSQLLVFVALKKITKEFIDDYFDLINVVRDMPKEKLIGYRAMVDGLSSRSDEDNFNWSTRQAYIALGFGLVAAANEEIDSVPIEGFNPTKLNQLLGIDEEYQSSVCLLALGKRDEEKDYNAKLPKVRIAAEHLFINV